MVNSEPTCELHLRMSGQSHDLTLRLHDDAPSEDEVATWMREGLVIPLHVSESGSSALRTVLVNFATVAIASLLPYRAGRGVDL